MNRTEYQSLVDVLLIYRPVSELQWPGLVTLVPTYLEFRIWTLFGQTGAGSIVQDLVSLVNRQRATILALSIDLSAACTRHPALPYPAAVSKADCRWSFGRQM